MNFIYSSSAKKHIKKIPEPVKSNIKNAIENLPNGDIKKLIGFSNLHRLRVGNYRVIYSLVDNGYYILDVLPRGSAYKKI